MDYLSILVFVSTSLVLLLTSDNNAQLSPCFYSRSCPNLQTMVRRAMEQALSKEPRMGASILRLFFHDCFVNLGGPSWDVLLGRKDATTASQDAANTNLPPLISTLETLISLFAAKGLTARYMTALSGAHTLGLAQCTSFRAHIYSKNNIDPKLASTRKAMCDSSYGTGNNSKLVLLDRSPNRFDNGYFQDLVAKRGLLHSDQELFNGGFQDWLVKLYSSNYSEFANDFVRAMIKLRNISLINGINGEIRKNCRTVN